MITGFREGGVNQMKKKFFLLLSVMALSLAISGVASAHTESPCNDTDGDGMSSGKEYAQHHIVALAHQQMLGDGGHKPGKHQGFNLCHQ
jgi:hypothetical protein